MSLNRRSRIYSTGVLLAWSLVYVGCSKPVTTAFVEGNVSVAGKPVTGGLIRFYAGGRSVGGYIDGNGHYKVADAPIGDNKVTVATSHLKSAGQVDRQGAAMNKLSEVPDNAIVTEEEAPQVYVSIDKAYEAVDTTKLSASVVAGENTIDLNLD